MFTRFGIRLLCVFWLLSYLPEPFDLPPIDTALDGAFDAAWHPVVAGVGQLLGIAEVPNLNTGSGDTLASWFRLLAIAGIALAAAALWSLDRKRTNDAVVLDVSRDYVRAVLFIAMATYGIDKLLVRQMPALVDLQLAGAFADMSPEGLLWRFMGFSPTYERFAGAIELLGGLLLLNRRTVTLGAVIIITAMTNVVLLNFCFDVPVKIDSTRYLLAAAFLAVPDLLQLIKALIFRVNVSLAQNVPKYLSGRRTQWVRRGLFALLGILVPYQVVTTESPPRAPPMNVDLNGVFVPLSQSRSTEWTQVIMTGRFFSATTVDGTTFSGSETTDETAHTMHVVSFSEPVVEAHFSWQHEGNDVLLLGTMGATDVDVRLRHIKPSEGTLMTRGFHWVSDEPFFR